MQMIAEILVELVAELARAILGGFFRLIGATGKWIGHWGKRPYGELVKEDGTGLMGFGILLLIGLVALLIYQDFY